MKKILILAATLIVPFILAAKDKPELAVSHIDPKYMANASAVMRTYEQEVEIKDLNVVIIKEHYVITILRKEGLDYGICHAGFSSLEKVNEAYGFIYDREGAQKFKVKQGDFKVYTVTINAGYYDDNKIMGYAASYKEFPFTVEYFVETKQFHTFALPQWVVRPEKDIAIEHSMFKVTAPENYPVRYLSINADLQPAISSGNKTKTYTWQSPGVPAEREEFLENEQFDGSPVVLAAPCKFRLGDFEGDMTTWNGMGRFLYDLNKGRDQLSDDLKRKVKELTAVIPDQRGKIAALFSYMQEHTRYVSIQYGIGGWQTLDAAFVGTNQYGDCKALSNYMMALLKEAGISSFPVIISSGRENKMKMPAGFAVNVFNHEILCVPLEKDTVWLECTSRDLPSGYLGSFTQDRDALMITPDGGFVVHTPRYDRLSNMANRVIKGKCNDDGSISFGMQNCYSGMLAEALTRWTYMTPSEKDKYIHNRLHLASYTAEDYTQDRKDRPGLLLVNEGMKVIANNMVSKAGNLRVVDMDLAPINYAFEVLAAERRSDFTLNTGATITDSIELTLPAGTHVTNLPKPLKESSPFGSFECAVSENNGKLLALRKVVLNDGTFNAAAYNDYETWIDKISSSNNLKVVLEVKP